MIENATVIADADICVLSLTVMIKYVHLTHEYLYNESMNILTTDETMMQTLAGAILHRSHDHYFWSVSAN